MSLNVWDPDLEKMVTSAAGHSCGREQLGYKEECIAADGNSFHPSSSWMSTELTGEFLLLY